MDIAELKKRIADRQFRRDSYCLPGESGDECHVLAQEGR
jgi:hypothetical protein